MMRRLLTVVVVFGIAGAGRAADAPAIHFTRDGAVEITGLPVATLKQLSESPPKDWPALLAVRVDGSGDRAPLLGSWRVTATALRFEPRFPFVPGVRYRVSFDPSKLPGGAGKPLTSFIRIPKPEVVPNAIVEQVYPSSDRLPENTLRFYLHFSAPMSRGEAYRRIHLLAEDGKEVDLPFLELDEELWDAAGKRFTILIDPGRIKRGLKPREDVGPALEEGKRFTLVVDAAWPDAEGAPMKSGYRKPFLVVAPVERSSPMSDWKITTPSPGTMQPLSVRFSAAFDHALLQRILTVHDAGGREIEGTIAVSDRETLWQFTPKTAWVKGNYRLIADVALEDVAGNRLDRPFDVDVFRPIPREMKKATMERQITIH
jgi:hypothetical protein